MTAQQFFLFAIASLMLNITPGADMLYIATRSAMQGVKAGVVSALGIAAGCVVHILAAVVGLSAVIAHSATAFMFIKYAGAAYLIWLGVKAILNKDTSFQTSSTSNLSLRKIFCQGAVTNILNPKVALFFLAFLPQFIQAGEKPEIQILLLGSWFNFSGTMVNVAVAYAFGRAGSKLTTNAYFRKWQSKITGCILIFLGLKVAAASKK